jgi:hypothetical protein
MTSIKQFNLNRIKKTKYIHIINILKPIAVLFFTFCTVIAHAGTSDTSNDSTNTKPSGMIGVFPEHLNDSNPANSLKTNMPNSYFLGFYDYNNSFGNTTARCIWMGNYVNTCAPGYTLQAIAVLFGTMSNDPTAQVDLTTSYPRITLSGVYAKFQICFNILLATDTRGTIYTVDIHYGTYLICQRSY